VGQFSTGQVGQFWTGANTKALAGSNADCVEPGLASFLRRFFDMIKLEEDFEVWCVLSRYEIVRYRSGQREDKWSMICGMYLTEAEAHAGAIAMKSTPRPTVSPPRRSGEPIAWLVTYIILMHETGEAKYHVEPTTSGEISWNDDRDVMAIFPTRELAEAFAALTGHYDP
jgi:hypothetical protein